MTDKYSRRWTYVEPGDDGEPVRRVLFDAEILAEYFAYWSAQMRKVGKADEINEDACLADWIVIHGAYPYYGE